MLIGLRATVVGGGIGGLTSAIALARRGARVAVYEQAAEIHEVGAGIQISPNGAAVLNALGMEKAISERAVRAGAINLRDGRTGRQVLRLDLKALSPDQPYRFLHRADLIAVLLAEAQAAGVEIHLGKKVAAGTDETGAFQCRVDGDGVLDTDLIVAADGLRSALRPVVSGPAEARFTGQVAWRALVPAEPEQDPEVSVFMGPGRHLVVYPLRDRRTLNIVAVREEAAWTEEGWNIPDDPVNLRAAFADFDVSARSFLDRVHIVHRWGLFRHPVAPRWFRGNVALLGDAAHPTLPFLAQGACMAIEDAWVLAASLEDAERVEAGLALYQSRRLTRCARIVAAANRNARVYHLGNPVLRTGLHALMRVGGALAPSAPLRRFDWLYREDVTTGD